MGHRKPYCKEGESESHLALAWAVLLIMAEIAVVLFLRLIGVF